MKAIKIKDVYIEKDSVKDCMIFTDLKLIRILLNDSSVKEFHFESMNEADIVFNELVSSLED